jgi:hypothetical protein
LQHGAPLESAVTTMEVVNRAKPSLPIRQDSGIDHRLDHRRAARTPIRPAGGPSPGKGMELKPLRTYLDSFRYGTPPHGGLGAGLNRIVMVLLGLENIRESTLLFRGPHRLHP